MKPGLTAGPPNPGFVLLIMASQEQVLWKPKAKLGHLALLSLVA
jgi:hypothetical protein